MPSTLGRNLNLCFPKIKSPQSLQSLHTPQPQAPDDTSHPLPTSTTFIKNFNSLYDNTIDSTSKSVTHSSSSLSSESESNSYFEPDFATIYASQRFFVTSPGHSNSIIESTPSISTTPDSSSDTANQSMVNQSHESLQSWTNSPTVKDSVAVSTDSPDPYMDFRRSMQEMVEASEIIDVKANWDYLHELLLCYLALNPKSLHKFIIGAFVDLLVSLMPPPAVDCDHQESELDAGDCRFQGSSFHV